MSIKTSYRVIKDMAIGNTVAAIRSRQLATSEDQKQWIINTFDLTRPPLFHHLISFMEKISELQHRHICPIREIEADGNRLRVVTPAAQNTLTEKISKRLRSSEETVSKWIFQIASALQFVLQEAKPVFNNLGPLDSSCCIICDEDNICVDIIELWLRSGIDPTQTVDLTTAVSWAPEYLQEGTEIASTGAVDEKGQIWALGIVAYEAAMMTSPFKSDAPLILMDKIMQENPTVSGEFSEPFRELLSKLLAKRPYDRVSIGELLDEKLFSKMSFCDGDAPSVVSRAGLHSIPPAARAMIAEQTEVSQPESGEAIEVFEASMGSERISTVRESPYSCQLF